MLELIGLAAALGVSAYTAYKARKVHLHTFEILSEVRRISAHHLPITTQQLQAIELLRSELNMSRPLPLMRGWYASPDFLLVLSKYVRAKKPRLILECSSGTSTIALGRAAQVNGYGRVISLEHEARFAERTRALIAEYGLQDFAAVVHAPLTNYSLRGETWPWYDVKEVNFNNVEMIVVDGPPMPLRKYVRYPALPLLFERMSKTSSLFLDDADRDDERQIVQWWREEFSNMRVSHHFCEKGCVELIFD